jgi:hypothetical protein
MPAGVLPLSERLRSDFRFLRSLNVAQMVIGLLAVPFAFTLTAVPTVLVLILILAYAGTKVHRYTILEKTLSQMRLEERFFRQHLDEETLSSCMDRSEHLWDDSHTLRGLRAVRSLPVPSLISREEKVKLVQRKYHNAFRALIPSRIAPEAVVPALALAIIIFGLHEATMWASMLVTGVIAALLLEGTRFHRVLRLRRRFDSFERALSAWTLGQTFLFRTDDVPHRPYRHRLLYRSEPVFSIRRALNLRRAQFE